MECPFCGSDESEVRETRREIGRITRRRRCRACELYFKTTEAVAQLNVRVRKRNGNVVAFDLDKVSKGIGHAALHVSELGDFDALLDRVLRRSVAAASDRVVDSSVVGVIVFEELRAVNPVTAIRYALVLHGRTDGEGEGPNPPSGPKGWKDANAFRVWLHQEFPSVRENRGHVDLATVVKRDGVREPFDRAKLERSIGLAAEGRFKSEKALQMLAAHVADSVLNALRDQPLVTTGQISSEILRALRPADHIAFLRFASTAKDYRVIDDYETEAIALRNR